MPERNGYGQFCPVSMAAEVFCSRWTPLILRELLAGTSRFNDLRRGVPRMSPALLSKRLKDLEKAGIITVARGKVGAVEYSLTPAGRDLKDVVVGLGLWGSRWVESQLSLRNLDPTLLMWDMRRRLVPEPLPPRRCTIQFQYPELASTKQNYWLVVDGGVVDLCYSDPGFEVDLLVRSPLRTMTAVWMGVARLRQELDTGAIEVDGDPALAGAIQQWLGLSPFAREQAKAAA
ncbi:helix-turn-helix domain-containing protein [Mesorhizobium sp. YM1C-6-2]|jgi:DNA-binding HxlR family transcriptional regulator|uniref:winged helix-turn-helix transcriptional regulator n=1 Tax=Mesorhizobium sp. YM1C-6-2 TaxID=1827501 RepID=UPI000EF19183|nr:helix-turn-helix domain-containing protein [Mesorhizobium sp. YM1C-6-2]RLP26130.1 transcriptional regulator [Mesorhizobium sp. YM1C-6-2]